MTDPAPQWHHTPAPNIPDQPLKVWLSDDSVREVVLDLRRDWSSLWFTDCTHPLQNALCDRERIKAWALQ